MTGRRPLKKTLSSDRAVLREMIQGHTDSRHVIPARLSDSEAEKLFDRLVPQQALHWFLEGLDATSKEPSLSLEQRLLDTVDLFAAAYGWGFEDIVSLPLSHAFRLARLIHRRHVRDIKHGLIRSNWHALTPAIREHLWRGLDDAAHKQPWETKA